MSNGFDYRAIGLIGQAKLRWLGLNGVQPWHGTRLPEGIQRVKMHSSLRTRAPLRFGNTHFDAQNQKLKPANSFENPGVGPLGAGGGEIGSRLPSTSASELQVSSLGEQIFSSGRGARRNKLRSPGYLVRAKAYSGAAVS